MVSINNRTKIKVNKKELIKIANKAFRLLKKRFDLSIAIVGPKEIKRLNRIYRKVNRPTDVLAFRDLNEIIICYQQAKKQAKMMGHSVSKELKILLVHGLLHLFGYDHKIKKEKEKMDKITKKIIGSFK